MNPHLLSIHNRTSLQIQQIHLLWCNLGLQIELESSQLCN